MDLNRDIDDGYYPRIKKPEEHTISDVKLLLKNHRMDNLKRVIDSITNENNSQHEFITQLAAHIYDKDGDLTIQLYNKMKVLGMSITPLIYNYFIWHAIQYSNLAQLT